MRKRPALRGRWAQGLEPRFFHWVIRDRLAICERPGGYGDYHRKVRRQEELIWVSTNGFTNILSFVETQSDGKGYDEGGLFAENISLGKRDEQVMKLNKMFIAIDALLGDTQKKTLAHAEELGDTILGIMGGYLVYAGMVPAGPEAILIAEQITNKQLGSVGRSIISLTIDAGIRRDVVDTEIIDHVPNAETAGL